ncbi:MAG TPA: sigma-70 family RNA polymerase sigma factor [Gemmatimonadales bacterium]|nr:sigma-70 family RNA polymerase sigma factor [Gemmatimonadales bacterium]
MVEAIRGADPEARRGAFDVLVTAYWRPVYAHLRKRWQLEPADAEDLTQEFFARSLASGFLEGYDPARARFRTYVRACLDRFVANARRDERRLKRGGGVTLVPLDFLQVERELAAGDGDGRDGDPDAWFEREWIRGLFTDAVADLRAACRDTPRQIRFAVFERYDLVPESDADRPSYRELAEALSLPVTQVTNHLAWARRELRRLVLERLRFLTATDAEFRAEAEDLFGEGDS